jgi:hypothetical protein
VWAPEPIWGCDFSFGSHYVLKIQLCSFSSGDVRLASLSDVLRLYCLGPKPASLIRQVTNTEGDSDA